MQKAEDVLNHYLAEMTEYELKNAPAINDMEQMFNEENQIRRRNEVIEIFNRYLTSKSLDAQQGRLLTTHFQVPPEHDDEIIKVEEKNSKKCSIYTKNKIGGAETRYDLVLQNGEWKIDTKAFEGMDWRTMRNQF